MRRSPGKDSGEAGLCFVFLRAIDKIPWVGTKSHEYKLIQYHTILNRIIRLLPQTKTPLTIP